MPPEISHVIGQIVSILQDSPNKSLLGSNLSVLLKARCPEFKPFDYEARNLREFLRTHVSQVYESSRQGLDFVYTLSPVKSGPDQTLEVSIAEHVTVANQAVADRVGAEHLDDALWKTYVSPSSPYRLFVNEGTAEFRVVGLREEAPPSPWVQVPPCPAARHRNIAEEFVATLPAGETKTKLNRLFTERIWWIPFFEETRRLGIEKSWLDFRKTALFAELRKTLSSLGVPPSKLSELRQQGTSVGTRVSRRPVRVGNEPAQLRRIALAIVGHVAESELRELRFRLGDVLDALASN